ncbi:MAG: tetratricopeptide repeat protein [SAR324 cluster bacterium]|nr:tetratricopeptide repeat protein [SAR324 cluster bacterium]
MYIKEGQNLVENHNFALAAIAFQQAINLDENNKEAHKGMGNVLFRKGGRSNANLALESFMAASRLDPFDEHVYALSAKIYEKLCMKKEATLQRKKLMTVKILQTEPNNPIANNNMGMLFLQLQQVDSAITYFENAIAARPGYDTAHRNLAVTYYGMAMAEPDEQKKEHHLNQAINNIGIAMVESRSISAMLVYGKILLAKSLYEDALAIMEEVEELDRTNKDVYSIKSQALEKMNRTKDAQEAFDSYQIWADQTPE